MDVEGAPETMVGAKDETKLLVQLGVNMLGAGRLSVEPGATAAASRGEQAIGAG